MYKKIRISKAETMDQHRYIMEQHLGRKLERWEEVHHKDEVKSNNAIDNLEVLTKSDHARLHAKGRAINDITKQKLRTAGIQNRSNAKMTESDARTVKAYLSAGLTNKEVCKITGLDRFTVSQIKCGKRWAWVII